AIRQHGKLVVSAAVGEAIAQIDVPVAGFPELIVINAGVERGLHTVETIPLVDQRHAGGEAIEAAHQLPAVFQRVAVTHSPLIVRKPAVAPRWLVPHIERDRAGSVAGHFAVAARRTLAPI